MKKIFISYRRADSRSITGRIVDRLKQHLPYATIFKDTDSIPAGENFVNYTNQKLRESDIFIPIIGNQWATSLLSRQDDTNDYVRIEVEEALKTGIKILPVFVENAKSPTPREVPESISGICHVNGINVRPDPDFESDVKKLIKQLNHEIYSNSSILNKLLLKAKTINFSTYKVPIIASILGVVLISYLLNRKANPSLDCDEHKIANIIADFEGDDNAALAHATLANIESNTPDSLFTHRIADKESRSSTRYHQNIKKKYFANGCDTSGLFVNGFIDKKNEVFNIYITNVGMQMKTPEYVNKDAITIPTPDEIEFEIKKDAKYLSDLILLFYQNFTLSSSDFIRQSYEVQRDYNLSSKNEMGNEKSPLQYIYLMRANHYSSQGNEKRAQQFYGEVEKIGNKDVKKISQENRKKSETISQTMKNDPELRKIRNSNIDRHERIENDFQQLLRIFGRNVRKLMDKMGF